MFFVFLCAIGQAYTQTSLPKYFSDIIKKGVGADGGVDTQFIYQTGGKMLIMTVAMGVILYHGAVYHQDPCGPFPQSAELFGS